LNPGGTSESLPPGVHAIWVFLSLEVPFLYNPFGVVHVLGSDGPPL
jgi:hypothetical protein